MADSAMTPADANGDRDLSMPQEFQQLSDLLEQCPETLASGNAEIQAAAMNAAKHIFDLSVQSEAISRPHVVDLITSLAPSQAPQTRSKAKAASVSSPSESFKKDVFDFTPLKSLFIEDMDEEQVWAQLDLRTQTICRMLDFVLEGVVESGSVDHEEDSEDSGEDDDGGKLKVALEALNAGGDIDIEEFLAKYGLEDGDELGDEFDNSQDEAEEDQLLDDEEEDEEEEEAEDISPLRDPSSDEESDGGKFELPTPKPSRKRKRGEGSELDDGFFNLAEFNAYTERAEAKTSSRGRLSGDDSDEDDMDVDLYASVGAAVDLGDDELQNDSQGLYYRDFFEPPARATLAPSPKKSKTSGQKNQVRFHEEVRVKKIKPTGKNRSLYDDSDEEEDEDEDDYMLGGAEEGDDDDESDEEDGEVGWDGVDPGGDEDSESLSEEEESEDGISGNDTLQRLKHDLFAEEEEENQDDMTTHERRMSSLRDQIRELESENVAKKDWTLMGEAGSRQRPQNSLLEEDLEFDRVMKAVPVMTEEAVKTLEETIKARILEGRFDDVVRIRPFEDKPFLPSKFFELQDKKSSQSLAQIYESEYVASQAGGALPDDRDGKLKKEHDEINLLWEKISGKLDALSNAHFVPKQPKATILTITNTATATLESALPTSKATSTMLAPEEVLAPSSSTIQARSELTPIQKRALRTKERKHKKRQRDALDKSVDKFAKAAKGIGGVKKQKQAALDSIVKHGKGVTVVGKKSGDDKRKKARH